MSFTEKLKNIKTVLRNNKCVRINYLSLSSANLPLFSKLLAPVNDAKLITKPETFITKLYQNILLG